MNLAPRISIIVPVYNVEKYLQRCIDSILAQTFTDFECIFVDDASPDGSVLICKKYIQQDARLKLVRHEINQGLPAARKTGLGSALGEYVLFVDSDDWIEKTMLRDLFMEAQSKNSDLAYCDIFSENTQKPEVFVNIDASDCSAAHRLKYCFCGRLSISIWNKLIKRAVFKNIEFPRFPYNEDVVLSVQAFYYSKSISYVNKPLYHYCYNPVSITQKMANNTKNPLESYYNYLHIYTLLKKWFDNNLASLEPELSNIINQIKHYCMVNDEIRSIDRLYELYPDSNKYIFNKGLPLPLLSKVMLFLGTKHIFFPYQLKSWIKKF